SKSGASQLREKPLFFLNHFGVDRDLPEFVHHDRDLGRTRREDMPEQCGLAAAERASDEGDGSAWRHLKDPNDEMITGPALVFFIRNSSFVISALHIPDRREPRDWFADPGQRGRFDHFVNVLVGGAGLPREARPSAAADGNAAP